MRTTLCLVILALAGCKSGDGFAVDLTVAFDNTSVTDAEVAQMTRPQSSGAAIMRATVDGTGSMPLVAGTIDGDQIARDAQFLYFDAADPHTAGQFIAYKAPITGGAAIPLLKGLTGGISLGVTNTALFVLDTNAGIYKVPVCGGHRFSCIRRRISSASWWSTVNTVRRSTSR